MVVNIAQSTQPAKTIENEKRNETKTRKQQQHWVMCYNTHGEQY